MRKRAIANNPGRDARLECACRKLFDEHGRDFTIKELVAAAHVSNTIAVAYRKVFFERLDREQQATSPPTVRSVDEVVAFLAPEAILSALNQIAAHSTEYVHQLLTVVDGLRNLLETESSDAPQRPSAGPAPVRTEKSSSISDGPELGRAGHGNYVAPFREARLSHDDHKGNGGQPVPIVNADDAPIVHAYVDDGRARLVKSSTLTHATAHSMQPGFELRPVDADRIQDKSNSKPPLNGVLPQRIPLKPPLTTISTKRTPSEKQQLVVEAAIQVLRQIQGPLSGAEIHRRLPGEIQALYSKHYITEVLLKACPGQLYYESFSRRFWANASLDGKDFPDVVPVCIAAVREVTDILAKAKQPIGYCELHSRISPELKRLISVESTLLALKSIGYGYSGLMQDYAGNWSLPGNGQEKFASPLAARKPKKMLPVLRRETEKILSESLYSMTSAEIYRKLSDELRTHYDPKKIKVYLQQARGKFVLNPDNRWHLKGTSAVRPERIEVRSERATKQARTKAVIDDAISYLKNIKTSMTLDDLLSSIDDPVDRETFRKGMNQRRKSSPELERIGKLLYRYSPVSR